MFSLEFIGNKCREYRKKCGYFQLDVANDVGYSIENVSAFENGRNDNSRILLWYIEHGLTFDMIKKGGSHEEI